MKNYDGNANEDLYRYIHGPVYIYMGVYMVWYIGIYTCGPWAICIYSNYARQRKMASN